jgi:hypothetical protein
MKSDVMSESEKPEIAASGLSGAHGGQAQIIGRQRDVSIAHSLARRLAQEIADPERWSSLKRNYSNVRVSHWTYGHAAREQSQSGLRTLGQVFDFWAENSRLETHILPASKALIFRDDRPCCVTGPSGSGKSLWIKTRLLPHIEGPLFLLDAQSEYSMLKSVNIGKLLGTKWATAAATTRIRFCLNANYDIARGEARSIFSQLIMLAGEGFSPIKIPSGSLERWVVLVEESHRYSSDPYFRTFVSEARKHIRKLILVCSDPSLYGNVARLVKPPVSVEELLSGEEH